MLALGKFKSIPDHCIHCVRLRRGFALGTNAISRFSRFSVCVGRNNLNKFAVAFPTNSRFRKNDDAVKLSTKSMAQLETVCVSNGFEFSINVCDWGVWDGCCRFVGEISAER